MAEVRIINRYTVRSQCHQLILLVGDIIDCMASLVIRKLDDRTKSRLRVRAAHHGRSMEEEARDILRSELARAEPQQPRNVAQAIRELFAPFGGVDLPEIKRDAPRKPPDFSK